MIAEPNGATEPQNPRQNTGIVCLSLLMRFHGIPADPIVASVSGTVQQLQLHTPGGTVQHAQTFMAIVPKDAAVEVEAEIENNDIDFIRKCHEAVLKLDAFQFTRYGTIKGHVTSVTGDAVDQAVANNAGSPRFLYVARVHLDAETIDIDGKPARISPAMVPAIEIQTGDRRIIEFVLSPLMKMKSEAARERLIACYAMGRSNETTRQKQFV